MLPSSNGFTGATAIPGPIPFALILSANSFPKAVHRNEIIFPVVWRGGRCDIHGFIRFVSLGRPTRNHAN